jgi:hypothetical protein
VLAAVLAFAAGWMFSSTPETAPDLSAEVAALQTEIAELRQAPGTGDTAALAPLQSQVAALEQAVGELRSAAPGDAGGSLQAVEERLAALETQVADNAGGGADPVLAGRVEEIADAVAGLQEQIAALQAGLEEARATAEGALAIGPAVAADALAGALQSGAPFQAELNALRGLGLDEEAIAGLEPHAASGLPTLAELRASFEAAAEGIDLTPPPPEDTGTFERLLESAGGLVEVRPTNPTAGDEPAAVLARMRGALEAGDLPTALAEWEALAEEARGAMAEWAEQAQARASADAFLARIRADALSRISGQG